MLSTLGARSFSAAVPCHWNSLPAELCDIYNHYVILKGNLKPTFFGPARTFFLFGFNCTFV